MLGKTFGRASARALMVVALSMGFVVGFSSTVSSVTRGEVSGTVTDSLGAPLAGVKVDLKNATYGNVVASQTTGPDGAFDFTNLWAGQYRVRYTSPSDAYADLWNNGAHSFSHAPKMPVYAGFNNVADIVLPDATQIEGTISAGSTPRPGMIAVVLDDTTPIEIIAADITDSSGFYRIGRLDYSNYKVGFIDPAAFNAATQAGALRPEFAGDVDLIELGLAGAFAAGLDIPTHPGIPFVLDASLVGVDCTFAAGADLSGQDLSGKNFKGCDLAGVDLSGADLTGADLHWSTGTPAHVAGATFSNTTCADGSNSDDVANEGACNYAPLVFGTPTAGTVDVAYSFGYTVESNQAFTSSVISGALPDSTSLSGATISGTPTAAGTFTGTIRFSNASGNTDVPFSIDVGAGTQTLTITSSPPTWVFQGGPTYNLTATASSGLAVDYGVEYPSTACTVSGSTVTFVAPGTCVVYAQQTGDANWNSAYTTQSFAVDDTVGDDCAAVQAMADPISGDLSGQDLHGCDLTYRTLDGVTATGANLYNAQFDGSSIANSAFNGSLLDRADFLDATVTSSSFPTSTAVFASFQWTKFASVSMANMSLAFANFTGATVTDGALYLSGSSLYGATGPGLLIGFVFNSFTVCANGQPAFLSGDTCAGVGTGW